jgi:hypothetical protein
MQIKSLFVLLLTRLTKPLFFGLFLVLNLGFINFHPYYVSNTDINYNSSSKSFEITCRIFTDNFEDALEKSSKKSVNILQPKNKEEVNQIINQYLNNHFQLSVNGMQKSLQFIGYEQNEDAIWIYFETTESNVPKKIEITNSLLYDYYPQQINMIHYSVDGEKKKSQKLNNPMSKLKFEF